MNRELQCLHCMFQFAVTRKYITENPATGVKHFDERRERPIKRMLTAEEEQRILNAAPPSLGVAIILLVETGGRTYSEGFSLRWKQLDSTIRSFAWAATSRRKTPNNLFH